MGPLTKMIRATICHSPVVQQKECDCCSPQRIMGAITDAGGHIRKRLPVIRI